MRRYGIVVEQLRRQVPGGIGTYARGLLQGLQDLQDLQANNLQANDVRVADLQENSIRRGVLPDSLLGAGQHFHDESFLLIASASTEKPDPLAALGEIWSPIRGVPVGHRVIQRGWDNRLFAAPAGLDVVHATSFAQPPRRVSAKRSERLRTMYVHDLAWRTHPEAYPEAGRIWHERALARSLREVDQFFVPSEATETALRTASKRQIDIHVIAEGCDHLPLVALPLEQPVSNAAEREGYLLTVSTREPRKNLARLLEAYALVRAELQSLGLSPLPLRIVGPNGWSNADGDRTLPAQLPQGVELLGAVNDAELVRQFRGASAFVYVPLIEGFGLPPLEAMRAGIPVVCSAVPSVAEGNPNAACIVDPLVVSSIADGIVRVLTNGFLRDSLKVAGSALASERTWLACAARHLEFWRAAS
jgi:glycosyltransferase involved in cell wall biosynthesis